MDEALLRRFAAVLVDVKVMHAQMRTFFRDVIDQMLPDASDHPDDEMNPEGYSSLGQYCT